MIQKKHCPVLNEVQRFPITARKRLHLSGNRYAFARKCCEIACICGILTKIRLIPIND